MKRHQLYFTILISLAVLYVSLWIFIHSHTFLQEWNRIIQSERSLTADKLQWLVSILPWYGLILFGCYCLMKLGRDLLNFNDCPKEIQKLSQVTNHDMYSLFFVLFNKESMLCRILKGLEMT